MTVEAKGSTSPRLIAIVAATLCALVSIGLCIIITQFFFPNNIAFETGQNPITYSQFGLLKEDRQLFHMAVYPFVGYQAMEHVADRYQSNNLGFLEKEDLDLFNKQPYSKAKDERLVILTGGGAIWGWGASGNDTIVGKVLEGKLNSANTGFRWKVITLAMEGWNAYQGYLALNLYGAGSKPDWIVSINGRDDLINATELGEPVPGHLLYTAEKRLNDLFDREADKAGPNWHGIFRYRELARKLDWVATKPESKWSPDAVKSALNLYFHALRSTAVRYREAHVLFVTQASSVYRTNPILKSGYDSLISGVEKLPSEFKNVSYFNAMPLFEQEQWNDYFEDDQHMKDKGHRLLAEKLAKLIVHGTSK